MDLIGFGRWCSSQSGLVVGLQGSECCSCWNSLLWFLSELCGEGGFAPLDCWNHWSSAGFWGDSSLVLLSCECDRAANAFGHGCGCPRRTLRCGSSRLCAPAGSMLWRSDGASSIVFSFLSPGQVLCPLNYQNSASLWHSMRCVLPLGYAAGSSEPNVQIPAAHLSKYHSSPHQRRRFLYRYISKMHSLHLGTPT